MSIGTYISNNAIGFDQFVNTLLAGEPDETLSARAWRADKNGKVFGKFFRPLIDVLFLWQSTDPEVDNLAGKSVVGHCERAYYKEMLRRGLPAEYRKAE